MASEASARHGGFPPDDRFAELSAILLGRERDQLSELRHRLEDPETRARDIAFVLAEAIRVRAAGDSQLRRSLEPLVEEAIRVSVARNPRMLAEALFPIFGKAIRRAIANELDAMMQSLSQVLEQSFSLRSIRWRIEAFRTNRPYVEIVLLRSLLYRVEQVFLIHRRSGILLQHAESGEAALKDPDLVSGMLTAIQDFVRDSITGAESEDLKTVRAGESSVVLAYAPDAIVAGFVRGVVPRHLNRLFQDELDAIQETETEALAGFSGDVSVFDHLQPRLRRCLTGKGDGLDQGRSATRAAKTLVFGVPALLLCVLAALWFFDARAGRRWQQAIARLDSEPGIVVTDSSRRGSRAFIAGMRDPLAADPAGILRQTGVDAAVIDFRWKEYLSLEPRLAAQRAYREAREQIERQGLRFPAGSAKIPPEQQYVVEQAASRLRTLFGAAAATHRHVTIEIEGGTDPSGAEKLNAELAGQRASAVQSALVAGGVERERLRTRGAPGSCPAASEADRALCRKVLFRVLEAAPKP